ncbi:MAG: single-stranded-DNA-specific exonuclease RecJ [Polyangiaceae bacterium]|nr:single-stranded-DNA-specific exonuclease RecJ [Polyangiaceae bacterium]
MNMELLATRLDRGTGTDSSPKALPSEPSPAVARLMAELGLTRTVANWMVSEGHVEPQHALSFLEPKLADLTNPENMGDRELAAERIARAVREQQRIVVFGDYDCDGMTATALFTEALTQLGGLVTPILASRFEGGYGLSALALERVLAERPQLVITCDCGSSDHVSLRELARLKVDAIVVDHHLVPEERLPALAFLNPHRPECGFPYKGLATCGLALVLVGAVRTKLARKLELRQWLDLVAIGTVADVAPLDADNRALVRAGLAVLARGERPGLRAIFGLAELDFSSGFTTEDILYRVAPRLNAPGRLGSPTLALQLLLAKSESEARSVAAEVEQKSAERRRVQDVMVEAALLQIERLGLAERNAIVIGEKGWNHGIVGIVAGRLADRFGKPVIVIGFEEEVGRGSVRGPEGSRLHDALSQCAHTLVRFGGHQAAAGLEILWPNLEALRTAFEHACAEPVGADGTTQALPTRASHRAEYFALDQPSDILRDLNRLEPFGLKNPKPELVVEATVRSAREVKGGHLKLDLELDGGQRLGGFAPGLGAKKLDPGSRIRFVGQLRLDRFRGHGAVEFGIQEIVSL